MAAGRAALAAGRAEEASARLGEALALWRGRALADVEDADWAQPAIRRLEEERLAATEDRIEADLALGRHAALVGELEALAAEHPTRERLAAQRMLALYRAGRQDDALRAYDTTRRALVETAGLEPGPPLQRLQAEVLRQDPRLEWAGRAATAVAERPVRRRTPTKPTPTRHSPRRARLLAVAAVAAVAAVIAGVAVVASGDDEPRSSPPAVRGNAVALLDAATGTVEDEVPVGRIPAALAAGPAAAWALNADDRTISRIDARTKRVSTFGTGGLPTDVAADGRALWVGNGARRARTQFAGAVATSVSRIDPRSSAVLGEAVLPVGSGQRSNLVRQTIAAADGAVWAIGPDSALARIDGATGEVTRRIEGFAATAVAAGSGRVAALTTEGVVVALDPRTGRIVRRISLHARDPAAVAVSPEAIWVTDPYEGTLWRIETSPEVVQRTIDVGRGGDAVVAGAGGVWVANPIAGTLVRVDARTSRVTHRVPLGNTPLSLALSAGRLWVGVAGQAGAPAPATRAEAASGPEACGPLESAGGAPPDLVIVTDLPLQAGPKLHAPQMVQAVELVLREHRFRAGRFRIAYRSCDDSTALSGIYDETRCAANALAYVEDKTIAGVVGPLNSGCAIAQIPLLERAGLAMVSPANSYDGLTRGAPDQPPGALRDLHPEQARTYARVFPLDSSQMAAAVKLVGRLGARRPFLLDDGGGYGKLLADLAARSARRADVRLAGRASWDPEALSYAGLARRVAASGADGVLLNGLLDTNGGAVARALRRQLPRATPIVAADGFAPISSLVERAGTRTARSLHVTLPGVPVERLPPRGRRFAQRFAATQPRGRVTPFAVYAAQATEVLLDAIARSDGTRASISRELLATRVRDGLIGSFTFDRAGDTTLQATTWVRPVRGGGADEVQSSDGARIEGVLRTP